MGTPFRNAFVALNIFPLRNLCHDYISRTADLSTERRKFVLSLNFIPAINDTEQICTARALRRRLDCFSRIPRRARLLHALRRPFGGATRIVYNNLIIKGGALRRAPRPILLQRGCLSDFVRRAARRIDEGNALFREVCADTVCLGVVFRLFGGGALGDELFDLRRIDPGGGLRLLLLFQ